VLSEWLVADTRRLLRSDQDARFLAIVGASGSGKSSLARAGLLHRLEHGAIEGSEQWLRIVIDHPGADPIAELATRVTEALALPAGAKGLKDSFIAPLRSNPDDYDLLHLQANRALAKHGKSQLLIFIDQFEEIFTACEDVEARERFVAALLHAARIQGGKVLVIITIRLDFLGKCIQHKGLDGVISGGM
jgi:ABC-type dipeptide/oligopeptide/nickel transport system ATPase component